MNQREKFISSEFAALHKQLEKVKNNAPEPDPSRENRIKTETEARCLSHEQLIDELAYWADWATLMEESYEYLTDLAELHEQILDSVMSFLSSQENVVKNATEKMKLAAMNEIYKVAVLSRAHERSVRAKHAAESRHSMPGGSREKRDAIRKIWASGKYTSKDRCAEEECGALDISFSTARKALRNQ